MLILKKCENMTTKTSHIKLILSKVYVNFLIEEYLQDNPI